nr:hypothetical protein [Candidatus Korarchaeota archaeon]
MSRVQKPVIIVHGGAGTWNPDRSRHGLEGVERAARIGFKVLKGGGNAVDSIVEAVAIMEDDGTFNAGYGSSLNIEKRIEMEASL